MARYASVYPLVSARAVSRPFTYLAEGLHKGSIVTVPFGRARRRGVVVGLEDEVPADVDPVAVERIVGEVPEALVDLALWLAGYYGSTPGRALALVAPPMRKPRGERPSPGARESLGGEDAPAALTEEQTQALARVVRAMD